MLGAKTDLRNVATAEEAYFADKEVYLSCATATCNVLPGISSLSQGVTLNITASTTTPAFTGDSTHAKGTGVTFLWDSENGGLQP